jgi:hypothetical protein
VTYETIISRYSEKLIITAAKTSIVNTVNRSI